MTTRTGTLRQGIRKGCHIGVKLRWRMGVGTRFIASHGWWGHMADTVDATGAPPLGAINLAPTPPNLTPIGPMPHYYAKEV
ncbi:MAG: hypothetical protein ACJ8CB_34510 [Ktedonobacteraceae bacterium]